MRIGHGVGQRFIVFAADVDAANAQLVPAQLQCVVEHLVDRREDFFGFVLARKRQQVLHDAARAPRFAVDRLGRRPLIGWKPLLREEELGEGGDTREGVVELVCHPGDELPDRGHLLRLDELFLQHLLVGDVADEAEDLFVLLRRRVGDRDRPNLAVLAVELRLEQPGLARERLLEVPEGLR